MCVVYGVYTVLCTCTVHLAVSRLSSVLTLGPRYSCKCYVVYSCICVPTCAGACMHSLRPHIGGWDTQLSTVVSEARRPQGPHALYSSLLAHAHAHVTSSVPPQASSATAQRAPMCTSITPRVRRAALRGSKPTRVILIAPAAERCFYVHCSVHCRSSNQPQLINPGSAELHPDHAS